jgi:hypothetical protein
MYLLYGLYLPRTARRRLSIYERDLDGGMTRVQRYPGDWLTDVLHEDRGAMCVQRRAGGKDSRPRGAREYLEPSCTCKWMYYLYHLYIHHTRTSRLLIQHILYLTYVHTSSIPIRLLLLPTLLHWRIQASQDHPILAATWNACSGDGLD